jgi:hypothetical protein
MRAELPRPVRGRPERIYQAMLAEGLGGRAGGAPRRRRDARARGVVAAPSDVPGAVHRQAVGRMQRAFRDADRYFTGERWVVGDATAAQAQDRDRVLAELRARYRAEYVDRWRGWLRGLAVVPSSSPRDAVQKLGTLGGPGSPLLAALALAARHTRVDTTTKVAFQPVHKVTPPGAAQFVGESNQAYASALIGLQGAVAQVANLPSTRDSIGAAQLAQAGQQGLPVAAQARVAAGTIAQKFAVDSAAAPMAAVVHELLLAPIADGERRLLDATHARPPAARPTVAAGGPPPAPPATAAALGRLNARGAAFCAALAPVLAKFPFAPDGREEATLAEVGGLLAPETGQLWAFYHELLAPYLDRQGDRYAPRVGAPAVLSPAFVAFFNRAARASEALYDGAAEPHVTVNAGRPRPSARSCSRRGARWPSSDATRRRSSSTGRRRAGARPSSRCRSASSSSSGRRAPSPAPAASGRSSGSSRRRPSGRPPGPTSGAPSGTRRSGLDRVRLPEGVPRAPARMAGQHGVRPPGGPVVRCAPGDRARRPRGATVAAPSGGGRRGCQRRTGQRRRCHRRGPGRPAHPGPTGAGTGA